MDSKKLEILMTSADLGSFTKASEIAGYTQSGLTHMMDNLEREIGFPLLKRGHSGVALTDEGEELMPAIREFLRANAALENRIKEIVTRKNETIRVSAYASMAMKWMPDIIYRFRRKRSETTVDLRMVDNALEPFELLENGEADVIFASFHEGQSCEWIPLYDEPMYAVLPLSYPLCGRKTFPITEFSGKDFLMPYGRFDMDVENAMKKEGVRLMTSPSRVDDETLIRMVGKGLGVTMMAELMIRGKTDDVLCVPVEPLTTRKLGMGFKIRDEKIASLINCVTEYISDFSYDILKNMVGL